MKTPAFSSWSSAAARAGEVAASKAMAVAAHLELSFITFSRFEPSYAESLVTLRHVSTPRVSKVGPRAGKAGLRLRGWYFERE